MDRVNRSTLSNCRPATGKPSSGTPTAPPISPPSFAGELANSLPKSTATKTSAGEPLRKYRNKVCRDEFGNRFDSKHEIERWRELVLLERAGAIEKLERQVRLPLGVHYDDGREAALVVDFRYVERGELRHEDAKGLETPVSKLKRAIARARGITVALV
jgi:hypothetical protein